MTVATYTTLLRWPESENSTIETFFGRSAVAAAAVVGNYQNYLRKLFKLAGVSGYPHKFRHTFTARLLSKRVPTEQVSKILGQSSPRKLLIHYSAWIKEKQELLDEDVRRSWENPTEKPDDGPTKSATNENRQNQPSATIARTRINID